MTFSCSDSSHFYPSFSFSLAYKCITVLFTVKQLSVHPISILLPILKKQDALSCCVTLFLCLLPSLSIPCKLSSPSLNALGHLSPSQRPLFPACFPLKITLRTPFTYLHFTVTPALKGTSIASFFVSQASLIALTSRMLMYSTKLTFSLVLCSIMLPQSPQSTQLVNSHPWHYL